jgi:hypothetical protein
MSNVLTDTIEYTYNKEIYYLAVFMWMRHYYQLMVPDASLNLPFAMCSANCTLRPVLDRR